MMSNTRESVELIPWNQLSGERQTELRIEYGHYLDSLPPTCSLETKIERFGRWLLERGVRYEA
jgi:hypothetical protein